MKKFRLPRKTKKRLKSQLWLYPADEKGNSLMANPYRSQKDFDALRNGSLRNLFDKKDSRQRASEMTDLLDKEIIVPDEKLKEMIEDIFQEDFRNSSFNTLTRAKNHPNAVVAYYNFVNAYHLCKNGDESYSNICCMAVDKAGELLRRKSS